MNEEIEEQEEVLTIEQKLRNELAWRTLERDRLQALIDTRKLRFTGFKEVALPLMQWLNDNCHPHCTVIVDSERAELMEGQTVVLRESKNL
jgi:hypothetical protein